MNPAVTLSRNKNVSARLRAMVALDRGRNAEEISPHSHARGYKESSRRNFRKTGLSETLIGERRGARSVRASVASASTECF